jgi:hypothetical protein
MGLDMYLEAKRYLWESRPGEKQIAEKIAGLIGTSKRVTEITARAAYWRKANHIHQWFVDNVQKGDDNCAEYSVSRERLSELVALCKTILANRDQAKELLPTQEGFFFGSTDYDQYYFGDLQETIDQIESTLAEFDDSWSFYYQSSW